MLPRSVYMEHGTQKLFHFPPPLKRVSGWSRHPRRRQRSKNRCRRGSRLGAPAAPPTRLMSAVSSMASSIESACGPPPGSRRRAAGAMARLYSCSAGLLETFGGLALVLGLASSPVRSPSSSPASARRDLLVDGRRSQREHFPRQQWRRRPAVMFCFTSFLYLAFAGPGAFSARWHRCRASRSRAWRGPGPSAASGGVRLRRAARRWDLRAGGGRGRRRDHVVFVVFLVRDVVNGVADFSSSKACSRRCGRDRRKASPWRFRWPLK